MPTSDLLKSIICKMLPIIINKTRQNYLMFMGHAGYKALGCYEALGA